MTCSTARLITTPPLEFRLGHSRVTESGSRRLWGPRNHVPNWPDLDARRVTAGSHSRHRAVINGNQRTRRRRDLYSRGAWWVPEDLVGHGRDVSGPSGPAEGCLARASCMCPAMCPAAEVAIDTSCIVGTHRRSAGGPRRKFGIEGRWLGSLRACGSFSGF